MCHRTGSGLRGWVLACAPTGVGPTALACRDSAPALPAPGQGREPPAAQVCSPPNPPAGCSLRKLPPWSGARPQKLPRVHSSNSGTRTQRPQSLHTVPEEKPPVPKTSRCENRSELGTEDQAARTLHISYTHTPCAHTVRAHAHTAHAQAHTLVCGQPCHAGPPLLGPPAPVAGVSGDPGPHCGNRRGSPRPGGQSLREGCHPGVPSVW